MPRWTALFLLCLLCFSKGATASPFASGWTLVPDVSGLTFSSTKERDVTETSTMTRLSGAIDPDGVADISIELDSLATGIDIRDARMRALLFETFRLPTAEVSARIDPDLLVGLGQRRSAEVTLPLTLTLNETSREIEATLAVTLITDDIVSVTTAVPIRLALSDYNLLPGLQKLEAAAGVDILPQTEVQLDMLFRAAAQPSRGLTAAVVPSFDACAKRIGVIGGSDQVYFDTGSAQLETKSFPLLDAVVDTIRSCPNLALRIEGHTDNVGGSDYNKDLSDRRAISVVRYLTEKGVAPERVNGQGFGEERPIADNNTRKGRWKNRRIEFVAIGS